MATITKKKPKAREQQTWTDNDRKTTFVYLIVYKRTHTHKLVCRNTESSINCNNRCVSVFLLLLLLQCLSFFCFQYNILLAHQLPLAIINRLSPSRMQLLLIYEYNRRTYTTTIQRTIHIKLQLIIRFITMIISCGTCAMHSFIYRFIFICFAH